MQLFGDQQGLPNRLLLGLGLEALSYIPALLQAFDEGHVGRDIHLGLDAATSERANPGAESLQAAQKRMTELHLLQLDAKDGHRIADLGCGIGGTIALLDDRLKDASLYGVNIDPRQLAIARTLRDSGSNRTTWHESCVLDWLSQGSKLDCALSIEAMFHFPSPDQFLNLLANAIRPGGRAIISTILFTREALIDFSDSCSIVRNGFAPWPHPEISLNDLLRTAQASGFKIDDVTNLERRLTDSLSLMTPPPRRLLTDNPVVELRRLLESEQITYPVMSLLRA